MTVERVSIPSRVVTSAWGPIADSAWRGGSRPGERVVCLARVWRVAPSGGKQPERALPPVGHPRRAVPFLLRLSGRPAPTLPPFGRFRAEKTEWLLREPRSFVRDGGRLRLGFAPALVDLSLVSLVSVLASCQLLLLLALLALLMTELIEKREKEKQQDRQSTAAASERTGSPHRDEPMDVDAPASPSSSSSTTNAGGLPFPGTVVDGTHAVVHYDLKNLSKATLRDLCDGFHLAKTGNKATLTDRLKKFSADRREWDGLLPGARNRHRGPRDPGVTKGGVAKPPKKKGTTKLSALRRELLFSDGAGSTTSQPFLPTERSKDMRTREEKAALLSWAREFVARKRRGGRGGPPHPAPAPSSSSSSSSQPYVSRDATAPVHGDAGVSEGPPMAVQNAALAERIQQIQAELATLMAVVVAPSSSSSSSSSSAAAASASSSSSPASASSAPSVVAAATATATDGAPPSTATPPQATAPHERPPTLAASDPGPLPVEYLKLANGAVLSFSKQSVPDPPSISFAKDIPRLIRMWDDGSPEWSPSEAVLRVQGVPIALKHWPVLYRYGKSGQWAGTKKNWAHWRDIATSWQELTEKGFWLKFSTDHQPMSYTAICEVLKEERAAANRRLAQQAKDEYGDGFSSVFEYRRGSDHLVKNNQSAIAKQYRSLQMAG